MNRGRWNRGPAFARRFKGRFDILVNPVEILIDDLNPNLRKVL